MPETKAKRSTSARKAPKRSTPARKAAKRSTPARKAPAARARTAAPAARARTAETGQRRRSSGVDRTAELSDDVLKSLESGQRAAIEAVGQFVDTVDKKLPSLGKQDPSRRQEVIDAALEMADRLVQTQYEFIRKVVDSAGRALSKPNERK